MSACRTALFDAAFRESAAACKNPYGRGDSSAAIAQVLAEVPLDRRLIQKRMTY